MPVNNRSHEESDPEVEDLYTASPRNEETLPEKRKRSEDSEDDSDENLSKKGKIDKGKGRAGPNDF